jgi:protein TonB
MFDTAIPHRMHSPGRERRGRYLPVAIATHVAAVALGMGAALWSEDELPEPSVPIIFVRTGSAPPPAGTPQARGAPGGRRARAFVAARPIPRPRPEGPAPATAEPQNAGPELPPDAPDGGEPGPPGVPGGVPGVPSGGMGVDSLVDLSGENPLPPGADVHAPELVSRIEPIYPDAARRARLEGLVVLDAIIATSGEIEDVRVMRSANALLDSAAEDAVRRWRYRPATWNGRAVRVLLRVTVVFRLH